MNISSGTYLPQMYKGATFRLESGLLEAVRLMAARELHAALIYPGETFEVPLGDQEEIHALTNVTLALVPALDPESTLRQLQRLKYFQAFHGLLAEDRLVLALYSLAESGAMQHSSEGQLQIKLPMPAMAAIIHVQRETACRTTRKLEEQGILKRGYRYLTLTNLAKLKALAENL